ncbi:hypothetical protein A3K63_05010 [Candidatus Micrarchaeota archaeon RBG_16_49_10]|nr:MAG: hypothetical protein A3K63_05010 [Candidatus Micrarchaeota archaeon RBG_16_49_10]
MKIDVIKILFVAVFASFLWVSTSLVFGDQQFTDKPMNASLSQPICIEISANYTLGVFFTNTSQIGTQYAITDTSVLNNATSNYLNGTAYNQTAYWVNACSTNAINVTGYHCVCAELTCSSGDCAAGTDVLYVNYTADGGVGWTNATSTDPADAPADSNYYFPIIDSYQMVAPNLQASGAGRYMYLRYWINPRPNNAPSGVYNTTYQVRGVEIGTASGTCSC